MAERATVVLEQAPAGVRVVRTHAAGAVCELVRATVVREGTATEAVHALSRAGWFDGAYIRLMLGPGQREIVIHSRPEVDDAELVEAMRWQVADSLSFAPEESVLDVLTMDEAEPLARQQVIVVAAQRARLQALRTPFAEPDQARIACIDIIDCAQRNLVAASVGESHSKACLSQHDDGLLFTVSRGRELVYTRVFEGGTERSFDPYTVERTGTQIRRALDTIERRSPGAAPNQILLGPAVAGAAVAAVAELSGLPVAPLLWQQSLRLAPELEALIRAEPTLVPLLGVALRPTHGPEAR